MSTLLAQLGGVGEEVFLGFQIPEAVMGFAEAVELGIDRVGLAFLPEIGDGGQRHLHVGVDELLAAFDRREVQCGLRDDVQALEGEARVHVVADHLVALLLGEGVVGEVHVLGVAAAGAYHVGGSVVDIVEVERSLEIGAARAGEEIQAAILSEDVVSLLDNRGNRSHHDDLIVAGSAGNLTQQIDRILDSAGVHIAEIDEILPLVKNFDERARALAETYWPGPLTMILPKSDIIPNEVCAGLDTVAIRMPSHPIAHEIIKKCGFPLAAPSANTSGKPSPTTAAHVMNDMDGKIAAVVDGGSCSVGVESTVVTLACPVPRVLRPGGVTPDQLRAVLGEVEIDKAVFKALESGEKVLSPGMKYKHYSPNAHVIIVKGDFDKFASLVADPRSERTCAVCFDGEEDKISVPAYPYGHADSPEEQARELFDVLRHVDDEKMELAFVRFPSLDGVGMAVYNRLLRAAGFEVIEL